MKKQFIKASVNFKITGSNARGQQTILLPVENIAAIEDNGAVYTIILKRDSLEALGAQYKGANFVAKKSDIEI